MALNYIKENLDLVIQNLDSVLYLKPYDVEGKRALFAVVKEKKGLYKKIQITKEQTRLTFPLEPIFLFYNGPGYLYLKDFIVLNKNWIALNIKNLEGFCFKELGKSKKNIGVFATFTDGSAIFIMQENAKKFEKQGGINLYIDLLKQYKDYEPRHDNYYVIDDYFCRSNTFGIPELLNSISLSKINYEDLALQYSDEDVDEIKNSVKISPEEVRKSSLFFSRLKYK